jgi:hypothetical protein
MKIDKKLVIEYKDLIEGVGTGNNMDFYLMDEKRLRYKFNEINFDENKFYECFDMDTLEILKPKEWEELSKMTGDQMSNNYVDKYEWDWLGDDFDDMADYLNFVEKHETNTVFSHYCDGWKNESDYMVIHHHDMSDLKTDAEKKAYSKGIKDGMGK